MPEYASIISIHASDTAGVCSMLYELGGMTVVHDASGCNSTYSTHDEPRWLTKRSMIYISALTESDAIMGNDAKFIDDVTSTARQLHPRFIAICGSPLPTMIGTDFDAAAAEIEKRTAIPTIPLHTNGIRTYAAGASEALLALCKRFCRKPQQRDSRTVNILGATPLDIPAASIPTMRAWLQQYELLPGACMAMDCTLDDVIDVPKAAVNFVVSSSGLAAAKYLRDSFEQPYVVGFPCGTRFPRNLATSLQKAAASGETSVPCAARTGRNAEVAIIGEPVITSSLAIAFALERMTGARVINPLEDVPELDAVGDIHVNDEADTVCALADAATVVADPMYRPICSPDTQFINCPSVGFSGRCFLNKIPNLVNTNLHFPTIGGTLTQGGISCSK